LAALVPGAKQDDRRLSEQANINSVPRSKIDFQLDDAFSDSAMNAQIAELRSNDPSPYFRGSRPVSKTIDVIDVGFGPERRLVDDEVPIHDCIL
jgi:hypothetical protein